MARKKSKKSHQRKKSILGVLLFLFALLLLISLVSHQHLDDARIAGEIDRHLNPFEIQYRNQGGMMGAYLSFVSITLVGWLSYFIPIGLILLAMRLMSSRLSSKLEVNGFLLFAGSVLGTMIFNIHILAPRSLNRPSGVAGGYLSEKLTLVSLKLLGELGSYIVLSGFILILLTLYTSVTPLFSVRLRLPGGQWLSRAYLVIRRPMLHLLSFGWLASLFAHRGDADTESDKPEGIVSLSSDTDQPDTGRQARGPESEMPDGQSSEKRRAGKSVKSKTTIAESLEPLQVRSVDYTYPALDHLKADPRSGASVSDDELSFTARMLKETLETFGIGIDGVIDRFPGPIITRYEFKPAAGIKVNQIVGLADDLALALKARRIRIIAPIPGKAAVGVEIPNRETQTVYLRDILVSKQFNKPQFKLPLAFGKTTSGKPFVTDLARMPHLLIAGATGSGKSVCMNVLITSLLYRLHPLQVRFILIDPKMLELSVYRGIPHLARPVVTKPRRAEKVLADMVVEMESRYRRLAEASVRNIEDYNKKQDNDEKRLPYIVIFVDELADLMISATSSKTELLITRLAQMSRAVGIHLILATQRPSVDVITGLIKANFPARIAFQVSSKVDSRTIIDANGAEKLLGMGDMLFLPSGQPEPVRIHGAYVSSDETESIVEFIKGQGLAMFKLEGVSQASGEPAEADVDFGDPLFKEACEVVVRHKQGSVSLLQRRLGIGYQRAARLIDKLEQTGIVSPFDGSKARDVMVDKAYVDNLFSKPELETTAPTPEKN